MATLILVMLSGRGAHSFAWRECGFVVEYTRYEPLVSIKKAETFLAAEVTVSYGG